MARRQVHAARVRLHDGDRVLVGQRSERRDGGAVASQVRRQDHRPLGGRDHARDRLDVAQARLRRRKIGYGQRTALWRRAIGEHFSRQREIDRPARLGKRDIERSRHDLVDGLARA